MSRQWKALLGCCLWAGFCFSLSGQTLAPTPAPVPTGPTQTGTAAPTQPPKAVPQPAEYTPGEFAGWVYDLRRLEIIFCGALPITFFIAAESCDIYRYTNTWDARYAPWPFNSPAREPYTDEEELGILVSALIGAAFVALTDYIIGLCTGRDWSVPAVQ